MERRVTTAKMLSGNQETGGAQQAQTGIPPPVVD